MTQPNDGGPAFPCGPHGMSISYDDGRTEHQYPGSPGMSLRDWLVGQALAGLCANQASYEEDTIEDRARLAIVQADETLKLIQEGFSRE